MRGAAPGTRGAGIAALAGQQTGPLSNAAVAQLFTEVMSQCRALEAPLTVAYSGRKEPLRGGGAETFRRRHTEIAVCDHR